LTTTFRTALLAAWALLAARLSSRRALRLPSTRGANGLFWTIVAVHRLIGGYRVVRLVRRPIITEETVEPWPAVPARSTFVLRRARSEEQPVDMGEEAP
jgi:hypothetical protein